MSVTSSPVQYAPTGRPEDEGGRRRRAIFLWSIRVLALFAVGITFYLMIVTSEAGATPAGCGPAGGCAAVLESHWGKWFNTPVAKPAIVLYFVLLTASIFAGAKRPLAPQRTAWLVLLIGGTLAAVGGLWFIILQAFVIKSFCPWCTTLHATGIVIAILAWIAAPMRKPTAIPIAAPPVGSITDGAAVPRRFAMIGAATSALIGVGVLIMGQMSAADPSHSQVMVFGGGALPVDLAEQPMLGPPAAPHRLLLMNDYTCIHCRELHHNLDAARQRYGDQFSLVIVPVPLNSHCNPNITRTSPAQEYACELAKLALAVWRADPKKFPIYDQWLYEPELPPEPETARRFAGDLVGEQALAKAQADPWISQILQRDISLYRTMGMGKLPKLVFQKTNDDQAARNQTRGELYDILERELGMKPLPGSSSGAR